MKAPVSVCMIARDEERFIGSCLESIRPHVEEIVVLDTGSVDRTPKIAAAYADRVEVDRSFLDEEGFMRDFSAARDASYSLGTQPWRMWIDADDVVQRAEAIPDFVAHLEKQRQETGIVHVGQLRYLYTFDKSGKCNQDFLRERLTPADAGFKWSRPIHEALDSDVEHRRIPAADAPLVIHRGQDKPRHERNLRILKRLADDPSNVDPMIPYYMGNTLALMGDFTMSTRWLEQCIAMPKEHVVKKTAYKHLCHNMITTRNAAGLLDASKRFLETYPKCASAYFCAVKTTLAVHDGTSVGVLEDAVKLIDMALTMKREDDDVFYNPWEWEVWAPGARAHILEMIAKINAP